MKYLITILCISLLLYFSCSNPSENQPTNVQFYGAISGLVKDIDSQCPLAETKIVNVSANLETFTDSLGVFYFDSVEVGEHLFIASRSEFLPDTQSIVVTPSDTSRIIFELGTNYDFWTVPTNDAFILFFRESNEISIDSIITGKIQYRLNIARTVDEILDTILVRPSWELGGLLIKIPDSIFINIDFEENKFNNNSLDSISNIFNMLKLKKLHYSPTDYKWIKLIFPKYYNMPILSNEYEKLDIVLIASANGMGILPEGPAFDIYLEIINSVYKFEFYLNPYWFPNELYSTWEIHVFENEVIFVNKH